MRSTVAVQSARTSAATARKERLKRSSARKEPRRRPGLFARRAAERSPARRRSSSASGGGGLPGTYAFAGDGLAALPVRLLLDVVPDPVDHRPGRPLPPDAALGVDGFQRPAQRMLAHRLPHGASAG